MTASTPTPPRRPIPAIETTDLALAKSKLAIRLKVFIAGPYIDKKWSRKTLKRQEPSAQMRVALIEYVESELHHQSTLGEHRGVAEMADNNFGELSTVVLSEVAMVNEAEAVVILPCSPGSFCELGAWSARDDIAKKMLILADKRFKSQKSYVKLGVFKLAEDAGARIEWLDYADIDRAKALVQAHVERAHSLALKKKVLHGPR